MDMQKCAICDTEFDFDSSGLQGPGGVVVCSNKCAIASAASRGKGYLITGDDDEIVDTNMQPGLNRVWR